MESLLRRFDNPDKQSQIEAAIRLAQENLGQDPRQYFSEELIEQLGDLEKDDLEKIISGLSLLKKPSDVELLNTILSGDINGPTYERICQVINAQHRVRKRNITQEKIIEAAQIHLPDYTLVDKVGQSQAHSVWRVLRNSKLIKDIYHALKIPNVTEQGTRPLIHSARFVLTLSNGQTIDQQEAIRAGLYQHPRIASVFDWGVAEVDTPTRTIRAPCLILEYIKGKNFAQVSRSRHNQIRKTKTRKNLREVYQNIMKNFAEICQALDYIHESGFIHYHLKPSNIMVQNQNKEAVLLDFSNVSARGVDDRVNDDQYLWSPQKIRGNKPNKKDDAWAIGNLLYLALTGKHPFYRGRNGLTKRHAIKKMRDSDFILPGQIMQHLPYAVDHLISDCLAYNQSIRPNAKTLYERFTNLTKILN